MQSLHPQVSVGTLCGLFGKSRQAWYKSEETSTRQQELNDKLLAFVTKERDPQSKIGTLKLQYLINKEFAGEGISIGRDALFNLLRANRMLIRIRKIHKRPSTNGNGESIYPDFRKGLEIIDINQFWCCDITYIDLNTTQRHCYATLVLDEKSHLIVGHYVSLDMTAGETLKALQIAVQRQAPESGKFNHTLIFHSDRGSQFKSSLFRTFHNEHEIRMSMSEQGLSSENPVSERINGILKNELMVPDSFDSLEQARHALDTAIHIYNTRRPHLSCNMLTPTEAHKPGLGPLKKLWKQRKKRPPKTKQT